MTKFNPQNYPLERIVPHAAPMILLDRVTDWSEQHLDAEVKIRENSQFFNAGAVPAWVGIEYMAQAIGAHGGICERLASAPVQIGFLVGSRRYSCNVEQFPLGVTLKVSIAEEVRSDSGLCVFACKIRGQHAGVEIEADAALNVFRPDNAEEFLTQSA